MRSLLNQSYFKGIRCFLTIIFTWGLILGLTIVQSSSPALSQSALSVTDSSDLTHPPRGVIRSGEFEIAPVKSSIDNKLLFHITSPTIWNRNDIPEGRLPVEIRAKEISDRLSRVFTRALKLTETPTVAIAKLNNRPILQAKDNQFSRPIRLVTITEPDAEYHGKTLEELASEWQGILQEEIVRFKQLSSPETLSQRLSQVGQILLGLLLASAVIWSLQLGLSRRQRSLETRYQHQLEAIATSDTQSSMRTVASSDVTSDQGSEARTINERRLQFLAAREYQLRIKRQLDIYKFLKLSLLWLFILMWYTGIYLVVSQVPFLMRWRSQVLATPLMVLLIWLAISFAIRISNSLIDRFGHSWRIHPALPSEEAQRITLRANTVAGALKGLASFMLISVGIIWTLGLFNIPTSSILAGSAVIGLAISFGSQSLVKDLVNGCLILVEDQFAVGDVIQINDKSGLVENLNLRVTQIRNAEGHLITIPNSNIINVSNLTRLWSRVDFSILVAYENDPKHVLNILQDVSQQMYAEPGWRDRLPELPEVLGIDDLSHTGMLFRVWIKTAPLEQWSVGREFRLRVRQAFETHNIHIGKPQWITYTANLEQSTPTNGSSNIMSD